MHQDPEPSRTNIYLCVYCMLGWSVCNNWSLVVVEPRVYSGSREMASKHVSLLSAFSEGDLTEWFKRFDICSAANDWDDAMQAKKMPTFLEGEALAVWLDLSEDDQENYSEAKKKIIARLAPGSRYSSLFTHSSVSWAKRCQTSKKVLGSSSFVISSWQVCLPQLASSCAQPGKLMTWTRWSIGWNYCSPSTTWNEPPPSVPLQPVQMSPSFNSRLSFSQSRSTAVCWLSRA